MRLEATVRVLPHPRSSLNNYFSILVKKIPPKFSRPCRPTLWDKLGQVELGQPPSRVKSLSGTRKGLQRGYMTCPMGQGEVSFDLSQYQLGQAVRVPLGQALGQAQLVPICLSHWDRLCLSQWLVPVGQARYRHHPSKVSP